MGLSKRCIDALCNLSATSELPILNGTPPHDPPPKTIAYFTPRAWEHLSVQTVVSILFWVVFRTLLSPGNPPQSYLRTLLTLWVWRKTATGATQAATGEAY